MPPYRTELTESARAALARCRAFEQGRAPLLGARTATSRRSDQRRFTAYELRFGQHRAGANGGLAFRFRPWLGVTMSWLQARARRRRLWLSFGPLGQRVVIATCDSIEQQGVKARGKQTIAMSEYTPCDSI
jgi:hypothetical protein